MFLLNNNYIEILRKIKEFINIKYLFFTLVNIIIFNKILNIDTILLLIFYKIKILIFYLLNKNIFSELYIGYNYIIIYPLINLLSKSKSQYLLNLLIIYEILFFIFNLFVRKKIINLNIFSDNILSLLILMVSFDFSKNILFFFKNIHLHIKWKYIIISLFTFFLCNLIFLISKKFSHVYIMISIFLSKILFSILKLKEINNNYYYYLKYKKIYFNFNNLFLIIPFIIISFFEYINYYYLTNKNYKYLNKFILINNLLNIIFLYIFFIPPSTIYKENYDKLNFKNILLNFILSFFIFYIIKKFSIIIPIPIIIGILMYFCSITIMSSIKIINTSINFSKINNLLIFSTILILYISNIELYIKNININNITVLMILSLLLNFIFNKNRIKI